MKRILMLLLALCILAVPSFADEEDVAAKAAAEKAAAEKAAEKAAAEKEAARQRGLERQAKTTIEFFNKAFRTRSLDKKMQALLEIGQIKHDLVIDVLAKKGLGDRVVDVREGAAMLLGEMGFNAKKAGDWLKKALPKNSDHPDVQVQIIRSIGQLRYMDALEELKEAASHLNEEKYRWVTVEVVRTIGFLEDARALPYLLWMSEYGGKVLKWATGSVTVDTGASGTADQEAAEKAWQQKYGHVKPKKPPAPLIRTYMQHLRETVKKITGHEFQDATGFRAWLIEHAEEYGLNPKELSK